MITNRNIVVASFSPMKICIFPLKKQGFTLLELLSAVAIVGVLAALLVPSINTMIERGNQTRCASNIRQILLSLRAYANDNDNKLPAASEPDGGTRRWTRDDRLGTYLPERTNPKGWENIIFVCPSATWNGNKGEKLRKTYSATTALYGRLGTNNDTQREVVTISQPSKTPLIVEAKLGSQSAPNAVAWTLAKADIDQGDPQKSSAISFHHNKKTNVGMADGGVRILTLKEFGETFTEKLWAGLE